jgi:hypothetical protein
MVLYYDPLAIASDSRGVGGDQPCNHFWRARPSIAVLTRSRAYSGSGPDLPVMLHPPSGRWLRADSEPLRVSDFCLARDPRHRTCGNFLKTTSTEPTARLLPSGHHGSGTQAAFRRLACPRRILINAGVSTRPLTHSCCQAPSPCIRAHIPHGRLVRAASPSQ